MAVGVGQAPERAAERVLGRVRERVRHRVHGLDGGPGGGPGGGSGGGPGGGSGGVADEVRLAFDRLDEAALILAVVDADELADGELDDLVVGLQVRHSRLEGVSAGLVARWDSRGVWAGDGSRAAGARLARDAHLSPREGRARLRRARRLGEMPRVASALAAGVIGPDHVDVLAGLDGPRTHEAFVRDEAVLVGQAEGLSLRDFLRAVAYWRQQADPDGADADADRSAADVYLSVVRTFQGSFDVRGRLDAVWGTAVQGELQRLEDELYADDVAEARARLGRDEVGVGELGRTPAQRRAAALVRMAERSRSAPAGGRRPEPLVTVVVGLDDAVGHLCELDDGTVLTRAQFLPLLERADIESIVFDSAQRALSVSVRERFFTGALRRVIQVRDRHCQHPSGCDVPAGRCQVDHIVPWEAGGPTTQANGRLLCGPHNRARTARPPPCGRQG
ncbi:MAG: DUF222 domain-containing protein [Acidimicrobiales bacterium]|nr:DUF222 domain-containing protein [Acidimicrobiales bacterium]